MIKQTIQLFALPLGVKLAPSERDTFLKVLPFEVQRKVQQYKHWQDQQRALLGSTLIRWALLPYIDDVLLYLAHNECGRPYIAGHPHWQGDFNLSHSGNWIVLAVTTIGRVGIDVEEIKPVSEDVMVYALSETERQLVSHQPLHVFYEFWTLKEALFKTGLLPNLSPYLLDTTNIKKTRKDLFTQIFYLDPQHPVCVCWNNESSKLITTIVNKEQLLQS
ncbi:4'-phosphopantetheinyl transferase superfamily protein [Lysinibacillus sp. HST-98]|uniref:4'-phosphopantetheinyl transferase family protein n=1 Tax=Lysinibacillus sp. HST-98 TaxID=2800419 RepID=UPI0019288128|nr:4'-phosphopantetheinyl transferase superfamily protein [Lysinibacillus sp. HST-98]MBL3732244.1 4'-phosphopantetheinyl transferase superfamily protein [Lysinibacillus sp. HST-98]